MLKIYNVWRGGWGFGWLGMTCRKRNRPSWKAETEGASTSHFPALNPHSNELQCLRCNCNAVHILYILECTIAFFSAQQFLSQLQFFPLWVNSRFSSRALLTFLHFPMHWMSPGFSIVFERIEVGKSFILFSFILNAVGAQFYRHKKGNNFCVSSAHGNQSLDM